jgi:hypothetical protein
MSFYFAHPVNINTKQAVSKSLQDKGLNYLKAKPCDVRVSVMPVFHQPAYSSYVKCLPAYIDATMKQHSLPIGGVGYPITKVPHLLPWVLPKLIYDYPTKPNDSKIEHLKGHSTVIKGRGKEVSFVMEHPTPARIKTLVDDGIKSTTPHIIGTVNLEAMKTVFVIRKILSGFLLTHEYPAFRHESDIRPTQMPNVSVSKKRKVSDFAYIRCITQPEQNIDDYEDETIVEPYDVANPGNTIELHYARPTTINDNKWGSVARMPNASGLYVPFVADLAVGDKLTIPNLISDYFLRTLASNTQNIVVQMNALQSAWGLICDTALGKEISHIGKCIDIALKAQAIIYPVYTGNIFEGCVISGAGYNVNVRDRMYAPIGYADLQVVVNEASTHQKSITIITGLVPINDTADIETCTSMRQLSNILKGIELDEISRRHIVEAAFTLCYENKYWSTSIANTQTMMDLLLAPEEVISQTVPMHPKFLFTSDRYEEVMSAFGHSAPTFMIPNGTKCNLSMVTPPVNFHVRTTGIDIAIGDMKYIGENGYITNNNQNLSNRHKDAPVRGLDKTIMWTKLGNYHKVQNRGTTSGLKGNPNVTGTGGNIADDLFG